MGYRLIVGLLIMSASAVVWPALAQEGKGKPKFGITQKSFGTAPDGTEVEALTLTNGLGTRVKLITYGATIAEIWTEDSKGNFADIVLGFDDMKGYRGDKNPYFGCATGRYANRIAQGKFTLEGKEYQLDTSAKGHHLHGGKKGFDKKVWEVVRKAQSDEKESFTKKGFVEVEFKYVSDDGEEGYPGTLETFITYTLNNANELIIKYRAKTDKTTIVNLTNHSYFNLAGHDSGGVLGHTATFYAKNYTPTDAELIPTGKIESVKDTPYDFIAPQKIGSRIKKIKGGYDINFVIDRPKDSTKPEPAARIIEEKSGRVLDLFTTEPGVQFYTAGHMDGSLVGKGGAKYDQFAGFCLEAQKFPDSPNKPEFPSAVLKKGEEYTQTTIYKFLVVR